MIKRFKPTDPYRWLMLALLWSLTSPCLIARSIAPLVTPILKDLKISYSRWGWSLDRGNWPYSGLRFAGTLIDKWDYEIFISWSITIGISALLRYLPEGLLGCICSRSFWCRSLWSHWCPSRLPYGSEGKIGDSVELTWQVIMLECLRLYVNEQQVMPLTGYSWRLTFVFLVWWSFHCLFWWFLAREISTISPAENPGITKLC